MEGMVAPLAARGSWATQYSPPASRTGRMGSCREIGSAPGGCALGTCLLWVEASPGLRLNGVLAFARVVTLVL